MTKLDADTLRAAGLAHSGSPATPTRLPERLAASPALAGCKFAERTFAERKLAERNFAPLEFAQRKFAQRKFAQRKFAQRKLVGRSLPRASSGQVQRGLPFLAGPRQQAQDLRSSHCSWCCPGSCNGAR